MNGPTDFVDFILFDSGVSSVWSLQGREGHALNSFKLPCGNGSALDTWKEGAIL